MVHSIPWSWYSSTRLLDANGKNWDTARTTTRFETLTGRRQLRSHSNEENETVRIMGYQWVTYSRIASTQNPSPSLAEFLRSMSSVMSMNDVRTVSSQF